MKLSNILLNTQEISSAYLGNISVFENSKTITIVTTDENSLSSLLSKSTLLVDTTQITGKNTTIKTKNDNIEISFTLNSTLSNSREIIINGTNCDNSRSRSLK